MFVLIISRSSLNMGYVGSKTRSLVQISLKSHLPSRGHSFSSIFINLHYNVCLDDDILDEFENGSCRIKHLVTRLNLFKTLFTLQRPQFCFNLYINFTRIYLLMISRSSSNTGHVGSKIRSLGQMSLKILFTF